MTTIKIQVTAKTHQEALYGVGYLMRVLERGGTSKRVLTASGTVLELSVDNHVTGYAIDDQIKQAKRGNVREGGE